METEVIIAICRRRERVAKSLISDRCNISRCNEFVGHISHLIAVAPFYFYALRIIGEARTCTEIQLIALTALEVDRRRNEPIITTDAAMLIKEAVCATT